MKRIILAFFLVFCAAVAGAEVARPPQTGECRNANGEAVRYHPLPHHIFKLMNPHARFAVAKTGTNLVLYSPQQMQRLPTAHQEVIYWHECGHHALGHTQSSYSYRNPREAEALEAEADCFAASAVVEKREFGKQELGVAARSMRRLGMPRERIRATLGCATGG